MHARSQHLLRMLRRAALLVGALAGAALTHGGPAAADQPGMDAVPPVRITGIIASIEPRQGRVLIDEKTAGRPSLDRARPFVVKDDTSITDPDGRNLAESITLAPPFAFPSEAPADAE